MVVPCSQVLLGDLGEEEEEGEGEELVLADSVAGEGDSVALVQCYLLVAVVVEVVALLVVHREIQMGVVPRVARPETHKAADRRVVRRETQRASVVGYSRWGSVASQAALEAVGEEGCPSCGWTSCCCQGPGVELRRMGEQAPGCSQAAACTEVGTHEHEGPR